MALKIRLNLAKTLLTHTHITGSAVAYFIQSDNIWKV